MQTLDDFFGKPKQTKEPDYVEVVNSSLACKDPSCRGIASDGRYYEDEQTLIYYCPKCELKCVVHGCVI